MASNSAADTPQKLGEQFPMQSVKLGRIEVFAKDVDSVALLVSSDYRRIESELVGTLASSAKQL
ncbi:MAG: hypothetical protein FJW26_03985 [Acidimicrobiia bacterium]|nr:hypothetical protein [Acidimicrobiia bacterium]